MRDDQWDVLCRVVAGERIDPLPMGFIIDSPWLPGWSGMTTLDYYGSDKLWFKANKKAVETFPEFIFFPGFWAEYGMCSEPSAFGARCSWHENNLPHADRIFASLDDGCPIKKKPNPATDGLLPFILRRLKWAEPRMAAMGHKHRIAVARGPLNIASFLMGTTEFLMELKLNPEAAHELLDVIGEFLVDWIGLQLNSFESMDGILLLDDIIGFVGQEDFEEFVQPCLERIYGAFDVTVKMLHNDAMGEVSAPYLSDCGVNLFNFSFLHSSADMHRWTEGKVALLGNIPPRDVLALGCEDDVRAAVAKELATLPPNAPAILSCGGGMPQDVSTANLNAFIEAARS